MGNWYQTTVVVVGSVHTDPKIGGNVKTLQLRNVLYVHGLIRNLLSVSKMRKAGLKIMFDGNHDWRGYCKIFTNRANRVLVLQGIEIKEGIYDITVHQCRKGTSEIPPDF